MALVFHKLVSVEEALRLLEEKVGGIRPLEVIEVPLLEAQGKVLAEDVRAPIDYPPFDRSTVDGYAVRSVDVAGASEVTPISLRVTGKVSVGSAPLGEVRPGEAYEIATGAMIPRGADAVVMEEHVSRKGDLLTVYRSVAPSENISQAGSDVSAGDVVLRAGTLLTAREIAVLAGLGVSRVRVYRPPRVSVFSTGVELTPPGAPLEPGHLYDVDGYVVTASLRELGVDAQFLGILPDNYEVMLNSVAKALEESDIVITTGSTSAGYGDMIYRVFRDLGAEVIVHGLKARPGKPTAIAVKGRKVLFGLPGFPLSAMMNLYTLVTPVVLRMMGLEPTREVVKVRARIPFRFQAGRGFTELIPVQLVQGMEGISAYPLMAGSGSIAGIGLSDGFIVAEESREYFDENEEVEVTLFSRSLRVPELNIIGSNCPGIEVVLRVAGLSRSSRIISVGSMGGWLALRRGDADIAGTHLLDEKTLQYNVHMPKVVGLEGKVVIFRGYARRIGLLVRKGNPKRIRGFEDMLRDDVVIVNRNRGSGTRVLLDLRLRELLGGKRPEDSVKGYTYEVKTHTAVATAIIQGRADVGLSLEAVARMFDLDFIPVGEEIYDFAVRRERLEKPAVRRFLDALASREFAELLPKELPGYRTLPETGKQVYP
ncbi:MAG: molybdenum cofactor synthesis domain [uncultured Acidilobus sp. JCHS]|nr:MAG: molybdenum cofactor synthesis domain [uncultured Acidilobus sp. JCHS]